MAINTNPHNSLIRAIYLYIFTLLGLVLVVIGAVRLLDLGMKMFIFKQADQAETMRVMPPYPPEKFVEPSTQTKGDVQLKAVNKITDDEKTALENWRDSYNQWQEGQAKIDYLASQRQRDASNAIAFILVGIPLYLYHWSVIKRDRRKAGIE